MNKLTVLFGVLLCLVVVNARHYGDHSESDTLTDDDEHRDFKNEKDHTIPTRHRRRRWQSNFGYDYQPPSRPYYDRRDNYYNQQDSIQQILRLLDDISSSIRRNQQPPPPPPPPQPIYIPYPVPYYIPVMSNAATCNPTVPTYPNITNKFPAMEDINQNWGFAANKNEDYDDGNDGSRPISFDPIKPIQPLKRPPPKVEHGSSQANQATTTAPSFSEPEPAASGRAPSMCHAAILSCCGITDQRQQQQCFSSMACSLIYSNGNSCSPNSINEALEMFRQTYAPINN